eukprot:970770-Rhodomonas_salina.1
MGTVGDCLGTVGDLNCWGLLWGLLGTVGDCWGLSGTVGECRGVGGTRAGGEASLTRKMRAPVSVSVHAHDQVPPERGGDVSGSQVISIGGGRQLGSKAVALCL